MPLADLEARLRMIARERIATGQIPCDPLARTWGGYGTEAVCALCDRPIRKDEIEYEVEPHCQEGAQTLRLHIVCYAIWQLECARTDDLNNPKAQ